MRFKHHFGGFNVRAMGPPKFNTPTVIAYRLYRSTLLQHDAVATILDAMSKNHLIEGRQRLTVIGYDTTTVSSRESSLSQELVQRPILQMFIDMELVEATIIIF